KPRVDDAARAGVEPAKTRTAHRDWNVSMQHAGRCRVTRAANTTLASQVSQPYTRRRKRCDDYGRTWMLPSTRGNVFASPAAHGLPAQYWADVVKPAAPVNPN